MSALMPARIVDHDLTIQQWTEPDIRPMEALITDNLEHLRPWMAWAAHEPITEPQRRRLFERWARYRESGLGAVYSIRVGDDLVGGCALHRRVEFQGADIGYWLGAHATGRGIASRTSRALTDAAFQLDDIDIVQISHDRSNTKSGSVAERLGYSAVPTNASDAMTWRVDRRRWHVPD